MSDAMARSRVATILRGATGIDRVARAFSELAKNIAPAVHSFRDRMGTRAPVRNRPKRIAKKLAKRGGFMRHNRIGAMCSKVESS